MKQAVREEKTSTQSKAGGNKLFPWGRVVIVLIFFVVLSVLVVVGGFANMYSNVVGIFLVGAVLSLIGILVAVLQWLFPRNPNSMCEEYAVGVSKTLVGPDPQPTMRLRM